MHTALAPELGRRDRNAAIAAAQVVQHIAGLDVRHFQHRVDDALTRRHVNHIRLSKALLRGCRRSLCGWQRARRSRA